CRRTKVSEAFSRLALMVVSSSGEEVCCAGTPAVVICAKYREEAAPSHLYSGGHRAAVGGRAGERGEVRVERKCVRLLERLRRAALSHSTCRSPSPLPFHPPLRG